ncbi:MAG TPA: ion transporter [Bacteroidia bacterium]|nr:ion transporter [Bacteroidia bacterium]
MNEIRRKLYLIVFGTDTPAGKRFDVFLLWTILISVFIVMLESVPEIGASYSREFFIIEWFLTIVFTIEYLTRIWISKKPIKYILSFWGLIDFLSIVPTYLSLFIVGYHYLLIVRIFRLLRVFRVLKLARFSSEAQVLIEALKASLHKISIFLLAVVSIVTFMGTIMYVIEGGKEGFTSIPQSIYWAVVTVTTVGYGDMVPHTVLGKFISSIAMIMGYAIIAVPTGIVTVAMAKVSSQIKECLQCHKMVEDNSTYCKHCGTKFT